MSRMIKLLTIVAVVAGSTATAFAAPLPAQDRTGWFVDSGRYINGQTPSEPYYGDRAQSQGLIEGRNSAVIGDFSANSTSTGRDAMVQELGN
jgi:hypothetical protein